MEMGRGFQQSRSKPRESAASASASSSTGGNDSTGNFECNICFELAQDPIVTLCGHLFCWPCLYEWLHVYSHCQECPVCKALVQEDKLVPLYGRGKTQTDPRSKSVPGVNIPNRPSGQRPQTAPPPNANNGFPPHPFGNLMGAFAPIATARVGNFTLATGFGGLFTSLVGLQLNHFHGRNLHGAGPGFSFGFSSVFHGGHTHGIPQAENQGQQADYYLKMLLIVIGFLVLFSLF